MQNRKLGTIEVSSIGMGCMAFSHGYGQIPDEQYSIEAIRSAVDYGCTFFEKNLPTLIQTNVTTKKTQKTHFGRTRRISPAA